MSYKDKRKRGSCTGHGRLLKCPGWNEATRLALEEILIRDAGKGLPVVFDFDNTVIRGDIGEATLAFLARAGRLTPATVSPQLCPSFLTPGGKEICIGTCTDLTEYYEAFLSPTAHGGEDSMPLANSYVWAVQVMEGLRVAEVVRATRAAFGWSDPATPGWIEVTPGKTAYPVPAFHPQMVELISELVRREFEVWFFSASNVWTVRWMVLEALNPLLRQRSVAGLRADHVVGISTLLRDSKGHLYKDTVLVRENELYARLDESALEELSLTSQLQFPVPTYSGKIAAIFDALKAMPHFAAGDSPGDLPMMAASRHRLWIARLEKPGYQTAALEWFGRPGNGTWLVQPTLAGKAPGFVSDLRGVSPRLKKVPAGVRQSVRLLEGRC